MTYKECDNVFLETSGTTCPPFEIMIRNMHPVNDGFISGDISPQEPETSRTAIEIAGTNILISQSLAASESPEVSSIVRVNNYIYFSRRYIIDGICSVYIIEYNVLGNTEEEILYYESGSNLNAGKKVSISIIEEHRVIVWDAYAYANVELELTDKVFLVDFSSMTSTVDLEITKTTGGSLEERHIFAICTTTGNKIVLSAYYYPEVYVPKWADHILNYGGLSVYHDKGSGYQEVRCVYFGVESTELLPIPVPWSYSIVNDRYVVASIKVPFSFEAYERLVPMLISYDTLTCPDSNMPTNFDNYWTWMPKIWIYGDIGLGGYTDNIYPANNPNILYIMGYFPGDDENPEVDGVFSMDPRYNGDYTLNPTVSIYEGMIDIGDKHILTGKDFCLYWDAFNGTLRDMENNLLLTISIPFENKKSTNVCTTIDDGDDIIGPLIWYVEDSYLKAITISSGELIRNINIGVSLTGCHIQVIHVGDKIVLGVINPDTWCRYYLIT